MKPVKITLTAFGPYKKKEVIDFRELNDHRLFVISGNTGAGKTTIFDAICFALYGEASGEDRNDTKMLRSHFATEDEHTSVDFEFELSGRAYRVFRQLAHIKGSNKTATGEKYELYELTDGNEVLLVDRLTVTQINEKLQQIIGLTKEQFSQIVMLPQGEFRKLLTSETEDKEEILRKIFKTGLFKYVTERLNEKRMSAQKVYEKQRQERDLYIKNINKNLPDRDESFLSEVMKQESYNSHQVLEALASEMTYYQQETDEKKVHFNEQNKLLQEKTTHYHNAKALNERLDHLEIKRKQHEQLLIKGPEMERKEAELKLAEKASHIEVYEGYYKERDHEFKSVKRQLEHAKDDLLQTEKKMNEAKDAYKIEAEKHNQREQATIIVSKLSGYIPIVAQLDEKRKLIIDLNNEVKRFKQQNNQLTVQMTEQKSKKAEIVKEIKRLEKNSQGYAGKVEQLQVIKLQLKVVKEYLDLKKIQSKLSTELFQQESTFVTIKKDYDQLETRWIEGQASILAEHLHDGEPCPVCGSQEHPDRAIRKDEVPTKELVEQKRKEKDAVETKYRRLQADLSSINSQLETKQQEVTEANLPTEGLNEILYKLNNEEVLLQKDVTQHKEEQLKLEQIKVENEKFDKLIEQTDLEKIQVEKQYNDTKLSFEKETTTYELLVEGIPGHLQSLEKLHNEIKQKEEEKQKLEQQWKMVQDQLNEANERYTLAKSNIENIDKQLKLTNDKREKAFLKFQNELFTGGFANEGEYQRAKLSKQEREALKEEIEIFKTHITTLQKQIKELENELKGKERYNLVRLENELQQLEEAIETYRMSYIKMENYVSTIKNAIRDIETADKRVKEKEQFYSIHKDLYDVVRGENAKKISFERYLLIEFLEQIVHVANQRLTRLSNGQFQLVRSDRLEKRGKQSGLSLDVYDNYTGQKRDVKTLSGGEKFNASLSLALGMADIIQSHQGGISIETMFIDEGFGSLDEESLRKAIDTLIELQQSGRVIGVISHVQELKQAIPAILDVKKTKEGHSQTSFIIK